MTPTVKLQTAGRRIVEALKGHWRKSGGMCRCPAHADHDPSLSVRVGRTSLLFTCFAGCDRVDILRAIRNARILDTDYVPTVEARGTDDYVPDSSALWRRQRAQEIWDRARPLPGTPAQHYLQTRGLPGYNPELRYLARTPIGTERGLRYRPALIAAVRDDRELVAIQRNFLDITIPAKARDLENPKMALGMPGAGAVRLMPVRDTLGIAEGIETSWSASLLLGIPVWAALGSERFGHVAVPDHITQLILLPDPGKAGRRAEALAREAHARPGRVIETLWPPRGRGDWNDVWLSHLAVEGL
ncbi:toprim domain-containing protein [Sphingobium sp. V4]|uniref:DUF7146 domain-containing protein n=1 Tax=Sphingobium sp. V4 TaxID=3038927 RepID=UPI0025581690|nr:toprim domain-containing protein [Sphingobium sp. V4]WIW89586.1 toprim domain-containing protein [Sphingobium sp. V4]